MQIVVIKVTACLLQLHMCGVLAESDLNITLKYLFEPKKVETKKGD